MSINCTGAPDTDAALPATEDALDAALPATEDALDAAVFDDDLVDELHAVISASEPPNAMKADRRPENFTTEPPSKQALARVVHSH
jgi:hypothetical protein